jgi:phenylacetate-CoA ligase
MTIKEKILKNIISLPIEVNKSLLRLNFVPELLYGKSYIKRRKFLNKEKEGLSERKFIDFVNDSITHTPFYSNLYQTPISSIEEFSKTIGFINRNILIDHFEDLISSNISTAKFLEVTTGGTSGKPARFLIPKNRHIIELSTMHEMWARTGWNYHTRAVLRNHKVPKDKIFLVNPITREFIFDNFRLNSQYVRQIYRTLLKYNIRFVHAYPSAAYQFCLLCKEQGLNLSFIKAFLCGSEGVIDLQKELIVDDLGLKLYSWYGHSEKLVLGGYCEYTDHYHIEPQYGFFELIGNNNNVINTPGEFGEIVGTTTNNNGMPLIRYRTGDYAEYVGDHCEKCGRKMHIIKNIQGRWDKNQIYKKDGSYITTTALNLHSSLYKTIDGLQYIQESPGILRILIIKNKNFQKSHGIAFFKHYAEAMGSESEVIIEYVESLLYQTNGKFVQLISKIN